MGRDRTRRDGNEMVLLYGTVWAGTRHEGEGTGRDRTRRDGNETVLLYGTEKRDGLEQDAKVRGERTGWDGTIWDGTRQGV